MGKSPARRAQEAAREAVDRALGEQKELTKDIRERADTYAAKTEASQSDLEKIFGLTGKEAVNTYTTNFYNTISNLTKEYKPQLQNFQPNLIDSPSYSKLTESLLDSAGAYGKGVRDVSEEGAARLYKTLAAPVVGFNAVSTNPAFNLQYDPRAMGLASKPPTVRSDVDSMKNLYTYNV
jgi:hypothetical protein